VYTVEERQEERATARDCNDSSHSWSFVPRSAVNHPKIVDRSAPRNRPDCAQGSISRPDADAISPHTFCAARETTYHAAHGTQQITARKSAHAPPILFICRQECPIAPATHTV
jgi:hypothetical protein